MSATDELRLPNDTKELDALLNERGQEHRIWPSGMVVWHDERTVYEYEPAKNHHSEYWGGILRMTMRHLTPEQVIAATLGRGTCRDVRSADHTIAFECSECGCWVAYDEYWETGIYVLHETGQEHIRPRFCPNCGAEVVE